MRFFKNIDFYICCFFVYCVIGWLYEIFLEVVVYQWGFSNRGVLLGPYLPIYGFGALTFVLGVYRLIEGKSRRTKLMRAPAVFLGCALIATAIELAASYICEAVLGHWPWQTYVDYAINFEGRIALSPSIRFGAGGVLFLYVFQPLLDKLFSRVRTKWPAVVIVCVMILDLVYFLILGGG